MRARAVPHMIPLDQLFERAGTSLGKTAWLVVDQEMVDAFGRITHDEQWIHTDPRRAAAGPFSGTVAHGFLTLSLCATFVEELLFVPDADATINYGLDRVRFPAPLRVGSRVRGSIAIGAVEALAVGSRIEVDVVVEIEGTQRPGCVARLLLDIA